jgi:hypothetical protein
VGIAPRLKTGKPPALVHHQYVARCGSLDRLQEDVDAAGMPGRRHPSCDAAAGHDRLQGGRSTAHGDLRTEAGIREVRRRQPGKPFPELFVIHVGTPPAFRIPTVGVG